MATVKARLKPDGSVVRIMSDEAECPMAIQVDEAKLDATTEADIARHAAADNEGALNG
jgi:hypothetical protein